MRAGYLIIYEKWLPYVRFRTGQQPASSVNSVNTTVISVRQCPRFPSYVPRGRSGDRGVRPGKSPAVFWTIEY